MAEFGEVIHQWNRMCKAHEECAECPMWKVNCACQFVPYGFAVKREAESCVMAWAAAHPERYPTWVEWFNSIGGVDCGEQIPADIAEKLGIEPKEGV